MVVKSVQATSRRGALLFVYGTLRPFVDIPMARWLAAAAEHVGEARAPGRLYDLGRYPGLVAARRRGEWVAGDLYRVTRRVLAVLDRYEAPEFERTRWTVELRRTAGSRRDERRAAYFAPARRLAWLYLYRPPAPGRARIPSGDYRLHGRERSRPSARPDAAGRHPEPVSGR